MSDQAEIERKREERRRLAEAFDRRAWHRDENPRFPTWVLAGGTALIVAAAAVFGIGALISYQRKMDEKAHREKTAPAARTTSPTSTPSPTASRTRPSATPRRTSKPDPTKPATKKAAAAGRGRRCPAPGGGWLTRREITSGKGGPGGDVRFADMDGDGKKDYVLLNDDGSVDAWRTPGWTALGRLATGVGAPKQEVRFANISGDRKDDYLVLGSKGEVKAWENIGGDHPGRPPGWIDRGQIASGTGEDGRIVFGDVDGDGKDDYLVVGKDTSVKAWRNIGGDHDGRPGWIPMGLIAVPQGKSGDKVMFADVDCDKRDDYLLLRQNGELEAWKNVAAAGAERPPGWVSLGRIASGTKASGRVVLADMNGDGLDDYLLVADNGSVQGRRNNGGD